MITLTLPSTSASLKPLVSRSSLTDVELGAFLAEDRRGLAAFLQHGVIDAVLDQDHAELLGREALEGVLRPPQVAYE